MKSTELLTVVALSSFGVWCVAGPVVPGADNPQQAQVALSRPVADDFTTLLGRIRAEFAQGGARLAPDAIVSLGTSGEWADIPYSDRSVAEWKPMLHLDRVRAMAVAYSAAGGQYSQSPAVRDGVIRALRAWAARKPQSDNWWHNTIGVQLALMPILVLMDADLPPDLRADLLSSFAQLDTVPANRKTGQNLIWYATQHVVRGALNHSHSDIAKGLDAIRTTLTITSGEGLQADLSFHQHGNQLYSGGYGLAFLVDVVRVASWVRGTAWRFSENEVNLLADFATEGIGPLLRGDWLDWSARGREITRQAPQPRPVVLRAPVNGLLALAPSHGPALSALADRLGSGSPPQQASTHGYWRSDFLVHQTPKGYFSVKMVSARTTGTESGNGENLLGYWLPFGTTFIVGAGNGSEYLGLQPLLDWSALPGTTAPQFVPRFSGYLRHNEDRVAVLSDATGGMASMQVNTQNLQARKFWFVDGETMVCLGADIRYQGKQPVRTTINQTRWRGSAETEGAALQRGAGPVSGQQVRSLVHSGIGYRMLDDQRAAVRIDTRQLRGADPTTTAYGATWTASRAEDILTLSIDHGTSPQGAGYAYAVVHGVTDPSQMDAMTQPEVLVNSATAQGVRSADGSRVALVFHQPGQIDLGHGLALQADHAVAALGQMVGSQLRLQVIEIAGRGGRVTLRTLRGGQVRDQQTHGVPSNAQRTRQAPAATMTLLTD